MPAGWVTVKVKVLVPPTAIVVGANALVNTGTAAVVVTQAPADGTTPLVALGVIAAVTFVNADKLLFWLVLAFGTSVHAPKVGVSDDVTGTMRVQVGVAAIVVLLVMVMILVPAVAVRLPAAMRQVPVTVLGVATSKPAGKVSVKLNATAGFVAICVMVNVRLVVPPNTRSPENTLFIVGTLGRIVTQAPVVEVPLVAELVTAAVMLVVPTILPLPLVFAACGQAPIVGTAMVVTGTIMVHNVVVI